MNAAIRTLYQLCHCLRDDGPTGTGSDPPLAGPIAAADWAAVIALANEHYLTPALGLALAEGPAGATLPEAARAFLADARKLNRDRNEGIRRQATELLDAWAAAGIDSVLLKGGAWLFEGRPAAFESRMMVDLDLLVAPGQLEESFAVAKDLGYRVLSEIDPRLHHLDVLGRDGDPASIEIHKDAGMQRHILPSEAVIREAVALPRAGAPVRIPAPGHRATHAIFHSEIQAQNNYALGHIPLRYLHDLQLLRRWHEAEIDWAEVYQRLEAQGYGYVVPGFLYLAERLFGTAMPAAVPPTGAARRHYRWCLAQLRWPGLRAAVSGLGAAVHPLRRPPVEYRFDDSRGGLALQANRLRHLADMAQRYRTGSAGKIFRVFRRLNRLR